MKEPECLPNVILLKIAINELHAMPINEMQLLLNLLPCYWCIGNVW